MNDFQELVFTRLQSFPKDFAISAGDFGEITKEQALEHVRANDEIGQTIIEINRQFFQALKSGELYACLN